MFARLSGAWRLPPVRSPQRRANWLRALGRGDQGYVYLPVAWLKNYVPDVVAL